jgi:ribonucleoside-diphosphate reductase alpha chain
VAIYRDGSKRSQPLNTKRTNEGGDKSDAAGTPEQVKTLEGRIAQLETELGALRESAQHPIRRRLPDTRMAVNHKFDVAGHEGYLTVGLFDNGQPGELFVTMAKEGSTIGGLMDSVGALTSMSLQYGVPLEALVKKFAHQRFEPSGFTRNPDIRQASSIIDYVFRWMACQFVPGYRESNSPNAGQAELPMPSVAADLKKKINRPVSDLPLADEAEASLMLKVSATATTSEGIASAAAAGHLIAASLTATIQNQKDAPPCPKCGHIAVRNGACYKCLNCGESLGCS